MGPDAGNVVLLAAVVVTGGLWWWWAAKFQHTRFGRRMTLVTVGAGEAGPVEMLTSLSGQTGTALTPLRPSGTVLIAGNRVDALTDGEFIEKGTQIRVVRAQGLAILVRKHS
jgi:membrane-bound serine protease (ClpP class)